MSDEELAARIETMKLLGRLKLGDEKPGRTVLRALRAYADLDAFVHRLEIVFAPSLHWDGPTIQKIIRAEWSAAVAPGHTDLMVTPEAMDAFLEEVDGT